MPLGSVLRMAFTSRITSSYLRSGLVLHSNSTRTVATPSAAKLRTSLTSSKPSTTSSIGLTRSSSTSLASAPGKTTLVMTIGIGKWGSSERGIDWKAFRPRSAKSAKAKSVNCQRSTVKLAGLYFGAITILPRRPTPVPCHSHKRRPKSQCQHPQEYRGPRPDCLLGARSRRLPASRFSDHH